MSARSNLKAYVFYSDEGKVIPMSLILRRTRPKTHRKFIEISNGLCCQSDGFPVIVTSAKSKLKAWVRLDAGQNVIPGSLITRAKHPKVGKWIQIPYLLCCDLPLS